MSQNTVSTLEAPVAAVEPSFIDKLTAMFAANGVANPSAWEAQLPPVARQTTDRQYCRFVVNSHWRHQLGLVGVKQGHNTSDARYSIVDANTDEALLVRLYEQNVLPWIKKLGL